MSDNADKKDTTPGIFSWNEILTTDAPGTTDFYSGVFGWKTEAMEMPTGTYTMFNVDTPDGPRPVAGMLQMPEELDAPTHWMGYVTVEKLEDAVAKVTELGGKICKEITELPMGRFAVITDPQGGCIGLWQYKEGGC